MSDSDVTTRDLAGVTDEQEKHDGRGTPDEADLSEQSVSEQSVSDRSAVDDTREPLLPQDQAERYRNDWQQIQAGFVDEPRKSVEEADRLVADLMQRLAAVFSDERERLEKQWDSGDDVSTEDLRVGLTRYRSFFDRLLST
jgi:hypothetical protein